MPSARADTATIVNDGGSSPRLVDPTVATSPVGSAYVSGQTPVDPDTGQLVEGSIGDQTRRCLDNLAIVAKAAGCGLEDAVRVGIYVTDISTFKDVNEAYATYFGDEPPARSTIGVAALPLGAEVEIDMVLALPD